MTTEETKEYVKKTIKTRDEFAFLFAYNKLIKEIGEEATKEFLKTLGATNE